MQFPPANFVVTTKLKSPPLVWTNSQPLCQAVTALVYAASQTSTWDDPRFGCSVAGCDCDFDYDDLYDPTLFPGDFEDAVFKFGNLNDYDDSNPWVDDDDDYDENEGDEIYVIQSVEKEK